MSTLPAMAEKTIPWEPVERLLAAKSISNKDFQQRMEISSNVLTNWKARGIPPGRIVAVATVLQRTADSLFKLAANQPTQESSKQMLRVITDNSTHTDTGTAPYTDLSHRPSPRHTQKPLTTGSLHTDEPEYMGLVQPRGRVVVKGYAKMGPDGFYEQVDEIMGSVENHSTDPDAYALKLRGDSNYPTLRDGWYVVVKPNAQPIAGEFVVVKLKDGRKMVKEFLFIREDSITIMSVNGQIRHTFQLTDVEAIHPVGSYLPPSEWHPD